MNLPVDIGPVPARQSKFNWKLMSAALVVVGVSGLLLANAHLVYVAFASQPECVEHLKSAGGVEARQKFRAARSAC